MRKRRIKKTVIKKAIILLAALITIIIVSRIISTINYHKTDEYKLKKIGYNTEEIKVIKSMNKGTITYILNNEYNESIDDFKNEKYFLEKNLERYLDYQNKNQNKEIKEIVSIVNVGADSSYYTNTKETDIEKKELMLVNKYHYLNNNYEPNDVINISSRYAYSGNQTSEEILEHYKKMFNAAENDGMELIISSAYRSYEEQEETYNYYKKTKGEEYANTHAALPGYSEHQTALAFDILTTGANITNFENTKEFSWLQENAHKYGFIMRYPKDKEYLTGYEYEPWHYRYVGIEAATKIKNENITFEEYYAYYIEG